MSFHTKLTTTLGIGPAKATSLIKMGLTKISDLKRDKWKKHLNSTTLAFLKYKPLQKIPKLTIAKLEKTLPKWCVIAGSYRRGKPTSRDVDIVAWGDMRPWLKKQKAVIYQEGKNKIAAIVNAPKAIKVDIFLTTRKEKGSMLLYATGSKFFNIRMRSKAKKLGMLLNQTGLWKGKRRMPATSEKDFFKALDIPYLPPSRR